MPKAIYLIGMPGSGKSTLAQLYSEQTGIPYLDVDRWIMQHTNQSMGELVALGQEYILALQEECLLSQDLSGMIVATPGSIVYTQRLEEIRKLGTMVYLDAPLPVVESRIAAQDHPHRVILNLGAEGMGGLYKERTPLYSRIADLVLEYQDESPTQSTQRLISLLA